MILFAADQHYGQHCGRVLYEQLKDEFPMEFHENDWSCFEQDLVSRYDLLVLNLIADTCGVPPPAAAAEPCVDAFVRAGKPILLLHGASAAFWPWAWWRSLVGYRWVRPQDPDGVEASHHPRRPYLAKVSKTQHPLSTHLQDVDMPEDEIYLNLEQTAAVVTLMETRTDEGTFPMCYETMTPFGGHIAAYLPGHLPEVVAQPGNVANCRALIRWLLDPNGT
ncbi:MAG: ThuA domain-containing protein [Kiritimatiellae bacterium]|nr:ThuA domain-containing protein [Kiritimatiellia bacterium]